MPTFNLTKLFVAMVMTLIAFVIVGALIFAVKDGRVPVSSSNDLPVEHIRTPMSSPDLYRTRLPDGWLVWAQNGGMAYVNDPEHKWSLK